MSEPQRTGPTDSDEPDEGIVLPFWIDAAISRTQGDATASPFAASTEPAAPKIEPAVPPDDAVEPMSDGSTSREHEPPTIEYEPATEEYEAATEEYEPSTEGYEQAPTSMPAPEPFPSFLDRRSSMEYESERMSQPTLRAREAPAEPDYANEGYAPQHEGYEAGQQEYDAPQKGYESAQQGFDPAQPGYASASQDYQPAHDAYGSPRETDEKISFGDFDAQRAAIITQALAGDAGAEHHEPVPLPVAPKRRRTASGPWLMAALFFAAAALVLAVLIWLRPLPQ